MESPSFEINLEIKYWKDHSSLDMMRLCYKKRTVRIRQHSVSKDVQKLKSRLKDVLKKIVQISILK